MDTQALIDERQEHIARLELLNVHSAGRERRLKRVEEIDRLLGRSVAYEKAPPIDGNNQNDELFIR